MNLRNFILLLSTCVILGVEIASLRAARLENRPPDPPVILEPGADGQIVSAADVHMVTGPFSDPDSLDAHLCTDWEIWTIAPEERIWSAACAVGLARVHIHLGDGTFENSHALRSDLLGDTPYRLRVRHRDDSGESSSEWSAWSERTFQTAPLSAILPLEVDDVNPTPLPVWIDASGNDVVLAGGAEPPFLRLESGADELLLELFGVDGVANGVRNPPPLSNHEAVRVEVFGGGTGAGLALLETVVVFTDDEGLERSIYLPSLLLSAGESAYFWVSANGSTFYGSAGQTAPDFSSPARGAAVPWEVMQPGYKVEIVATGFQLPVGIAFVPNPGQDPEDPFYYVAELYGNIKVVKRGGEIATYAADLLNFDPVGNFPGSGEQGLAAITVDPLSGDVFATLVYSSDPLDPLAPHYPKVIRLSSVDGGLSAAVETAVLDMAGAVQGPSHQVSNVSIGPDGMLYVHLGDGLDAPAAQDLDSYLGKVLRLNFDGSPAPDNPFYDPGDGINARDYVYGYGFRNPFGGAWRALDGKHYIVDNGPSVDRMVQLVAGRNYLHDGSDASMYNYAIYNWVPSAAPVNMAFIGQQTFGGSAFPPAKMDHAFVTESGATWASGLPPNGKRISEFVLDGAGNLAAGPFTLIEYNGSGKATAAALAAGPDGLYFSDLYKDENYESAIDAGANVLRIKFVGAVDFTADVTTGEAPLAVQFSDQSTVPSPSAWFWEFGDGATSTLQHATHVYNEGGMYDVRLTVTGANGLALVQKNDYITVDYPVGIGDDRAGYPTRYALHANFPNPFTSSTEIRYDLPAASRIELAVFTVDGRRVATLVDGFRPAGVHAVRWDGRGTRGNRAAAGVYMCRLKIFGNDAGAFMKTRKMILVK